MSRMIHRINVILQNDEIRMIEAEDNETILNAMARHGIFYPSACGGRGTCGKCKVMVLEGNIIATPEDYRSFTEQELQQAYCLSCKAKVKGELTIKLLAPEETGMEVLSNSMRKVRSVLNPLQYYIAIDLGTTTIVVTLIDSVGNNLATFTSINPQRSYGADVISRINISNKGKKHELMEMIRKTIRDGILAVIQKAVVEAGKVKRVAIAGNTTMVHLYMGYSCTGLGTYPFQPVNIGFIEDSLEGIDAIPVTLLPGITTFVGGDIVSGLAVCGFHRKEESCLLIDLGTNGEMALGNKDKILVTSTAAGPAFEGGNLSCGTGSIPGAISHMNIKGNEISYETIGNKPPIGICGTGVIEIISELLRVGIIDETGLLTDAYFEQGYTITEDIKVTQKDIRELQLAKAAVRAGVEILASNYGITLDHISTVYLAGGFGFHLDIDKAVHIGLLPPELKENIKVIGNSSLSGAISYLTEPNMKEAMQHIVSVSGEIHLSNEPDFNELYLQYMSFDNE